MAEFKITQPELAAPSHGQRQRPHLRKILSWSPETGREEVWRRRKGNHNQKSASRSRLGRSVTDEDLDELKACIELGFGFEPDSPDLDPRLSDALPALGFYCAVNRQYNEIILSRTSSDSSISVGSGEDAETVKTRLRQWARVVACSVKQLAGSQQINKTD
ncbi:unnamed protein product [Linum tenue]|uniref:Uncharacterized protein n=1 Tax=Linum tenue TaxID=586396 RepID=A0AAV0RJP9_9ROSI|nr:unnamed protein product [Linum tenue]